MSRSIKRAFSLVLCLVLVLSLGAFGVSAAEEDGSALEPIVYGSFGGADTVNGKAAPRYASVLNKDVTEAISDDVAWHNGAVFSEAGAYTVSADVTMNSAADGSDTNDFSGLGAALMATGKGVTVTVEDATVETTGVAKLALFTDAGALSLIKNSTLISNSGTIYEGYMSTADQIMMVAPPWVLGLGGAKTNARTTNIMGDYSTSAYVDSTVKAGGWGALSTDSGSNMHLVVVNTEVDVEDSGYGAYTIGESTEDYYGVQENVSTYANIMTGGVATYQSYTGGQEIEVVQYNGEKDEYGFGKGGDVVATVKSDKVAEGEVVPSVIKSENFGFMCHANGSDGYNIVNLLDGTTVESGNATFLVKKINSIFNVDKATIKSADGVLLQIIDNDDDYVGLDFTANWGMEDGYGHSVGGHIPTFNSVFHEEAGYSNEWTKAEPAEGGMPGGDMPGAPEGGMPGGPGGMPAMAAPEYYTSELNLTNTAVTGDVWNSTGYVGSNPATRLTVNLGEGADLTGVISAGAFSHDTKDATVGNGNWDAASVLGHVSNVVNSNGDNQVAVSLTDDAVWTVKADSLIDSLSVKGSAKVVVPAGVTLTVGGKTYTDTTIEAEPISENDYQTMTVDGKAVDPEKYAIDGHNYFKLRDIAAILNGSASQIGVAYDEETDSVQITTGAAYESVGGELSHSGAGAKYAPTRQSVWVDGKEVQLTVYAIGGYNYFMLRDLATVLNGTASQFNVTFDEAARQIVVTTGAAYEGK